MNYVETITIDLEKVLEMIVDNEGMPEYNSGNPSMIYVNTLNHVSYISLSPGTYYQHGYVVDPENLFNMEEIDKNYPLDLDDFRTTAKDNVKSEIVKDFDDFSDEDWEKVSEYEQEWIDEWKQWARPEKKEIFEIENSQGEVVAVYKIEWI